MLSPSQSPRTANTLRLVQLMEERQRLEIGERITELRERSPFTQPRIAEGLGLTVRGYQKLEEKGTTSFERCEELYEIHREWSSRSDDYQHISAQWIWDGKGKGKTPDLMATFSKAPKPSEFSEPDARLLSGQIAALHADVAALAAAIQETPRRSQEPPEESAEEQKPPRPSG